MERFDDSPDPVGPPLVRAVVVASQGGPYEDLAFFAGWYVGMMDATLSWQAQISDGCWRRTAAVPDELCRQIELVAARHGCVMTYLVDDDPGRELEDPPGQRLVAFNYHTHESAPLMDNEGHRML